MGWAILNGNMEGNKRGKLTYVRVRGGLVIDYVIGNEELRESVEKIVVEEEWIQIIFQ